MPITLNWDCTVFRKVLSTEDLAEVGVIVAAWEYRAKWYEEDEKMAKACASGLEGGGAGTAKAPLQTNVKLRRFRSFTCPITLVSIHQEQETAVRRAVQLMEKSFWVPLALPADSMCRADGM